ncbi:glycosyltransferase [Rhodobacter ferrooxidans]|uniref:Putative cellulose synthase protein n=1 Tax=Rhodobacter ferrooxidans TaxID=371731 RepID=C8RY45_9RHOB|nr:glycosyltransferase [Rhodobacter sp. SW2]EEW26443.1 putative cellulose synthase protein [Rhodobacter sp. SW2]
MIRAHETGNAAFLSPILWGRIRVKYGLGVVLWLTASVYFWQWWLRPDHVLGWGRYGLITALLVWTYLLQVYFLFFLMRASRSSAPAPYPGKYRVAMIVTKTPSEPFAIVQRTLEAMLAQDYPHDTWLADESPQPETIIWCRKHGVLISSRKGRSAYHRPTWPRRTRCKEGNLAFFYDQWGYANYDIVSQLDADHVPQPGYLREMLRPFADPGVGYVSAPSICSSNAGTNWAARTRLDTEAAFHGALQAGYSDGFAPMCIGSHYAVRTKALKAVGGLGPDLAEDHSTTMILNAGGWRGVHAVDAIAIGDGPASVADMITQEFQWSRSLVTLLLQHTPRYLGHLTPRLRAQFLFCQMLYPLLALTLTAMYLVPITAVVFDIRYAAVTYPDYLQHAVPTVLVMLVIATSIRRDGLFRPADAKVISWEKVLFVLLQWPWVLWGSVMALRDALTGQFVDFRITPKGEAARARLPMKVIMVYTALALGCIVPVLLFGNNQNAQGFYLLTLLNGLLYGVTVIMTVLRHIAENGIAWHGNVLNTLGQFAAVALVLVLLGTGFVWRGIESLHALTFGLSPIRVTRAEFSVSGAGSDTKPTIHFRFEPGWTR